MSRTYDLAGNLLSLTDPAHNVTFWAYDRLDRVTTETNSLGGTRSFTYDAAGNRTQQTDRLGRVTQFTYDALHRLTAEHWQDGEATLRTLAFAYDAAGQLTSATDPAATYDYIYDQLGRLLTTTSDLAGVSPLVELTNAFDAAGNRTSLAAKVGSTDDFLNTYTHDGLNRLTRIAQAGQVGGNVVTDKHIDLSYNALGQWDTFTRYQSLDTAKLIASSSFAYDLASRLTSISHTRNTTGLAGYVYTYDAADRITSIDSLLDGLAEYAYDNAGQLIAANHAAQTDETYTYDDNGNRVMAGHVVSTDNRLLSDGTYNYTYDAEGNRTSRTEIATGEKLEYAWDYRNRLTLVTYKDGSNVVTKQVAYEYDAFDRRVRKQVDETGNGSWDRGEQYVYDDDHIALVFDDSGNLLRRNLHGEAIDQIFASEFVDTGETNWYLTDHLGTVRDVYSYDDALNDIASGGHITYDSFGNILAGSTAAEKAGFTYTGREWDADAQLYYYRKRWYDAATGQFVSQDPIGFAAGDGNLRRYVFNQPTLLVDPSGLSYREAYRNATPEMPDDWQVHHTFQQAEDLRKRYADAGIDVDDPKYLRSVDPIIHSEISAVQQKFWANKTKKYGDRATAYAKTPMSEIKRLNKEIEATYGTVMVKCGSSKLDFATAQKKAATLLADRNYAVMKAKRVTSTLKKAGITLAFTGLLFSLGEQTVTAKEIANPSPETQAAFDEFLQQYRFGLDYTLRTNANLNARQLECLHDAAQKYLQAIGANADVRNQLRKTFIELQASEGE